MYMSFKLLDIFCFLTFVTLPLLGLRMKSLWRRVREEERSSRKWSLWIAFCGAFLSVMAFDLQHFFAHPKLLQTLVGLYGLSFYALLYHFGPLLRERLGMPWKTSIRIYLLMLLVGATTMKLGGEKGAALFISTCASLGVLAWRTCSIVQTIILLIQLVLTLVVYFFARGPLMWIIGFGVLANAIIFIYEPKVRASSETN